MPKKNILGQKFGRLVPISYIESDKHGKAKWLCRCDCGRTIVAIASNLIKRNTKSCGCLSDEKKRTKGKNSYSFSGAGWLRSTYISSAQKRNLEFSLTLEEFIKITSQPCHYCGVLPFRVVKSRKTKKLIFL